MVVLTKISKMTKKSKKITQETTSDSKFLKISRQYPSKSRKDCFPTNFSMNSAISSDKFKADNKLKGVHLLLRVE
jgi:hypothetical protein